MGILSNLARFGTMFLFVGVLFAGCAGGDGQAPVDEANDPTNPSNISQQQSGGGDSSSSGGDSSAQ